MRVASLRCVPYRNARDAPIDLRTLDDSRMQTMGARIAAVVPSS